MEPNLTWVLRAVVAIAVALVLAGPAAAKTITGTARNDVLRGTAGNDVIYGKAGNDTITGVAGNDLIVGGPGADRISCGPGRDTVVADAQDSIAKDCEIVKGLPAPVRRPPEGDYVGSTSQQHRFGFDVAGHGAEITGISLSIDGAKITSFSASFSAQCPGATGNFTWTWSAASSLEVGPDRQATLSGQLNDGTLVNISFSFDAAGFVDGTMSFQQLPALDAQGNKIVCGSETITFSGEP